MDVFLPSAGFWQPVEIPPTVLFDLLKDIDREVLDLASTEPEPEPEPGLDTAVEVAEEAEQQKDVSILWAQPSEVEIGDDLWSLVLESSGTRNVYS